MKKTVLIVLIVFLIACALIYFLQNHKLLPAPEKGIEACKTLEYNGKNKINVVFFAPKEKVLEYSNILLGSSPFKEDTNSFNIFYIDSYQPECQIYKGIALLCYSKNLIKTASSCPNDYIIVIQDKNATIRSSAYINTISINSNNEKNVVLHEFGHAFAGLADEYTPATLPKNAPNCVSNCSQFGIYKDCFQGCSKENYYRSMDSGLMRTLFSSSFGAFNNAVIQQQLLRQTISLTSKVIEEIQECQKEQYYLIEGNYSEGKIQVISRSIEEGCIGTSGQGPFDYSLIMENGTEFTGNFKELHLTVPREDSADCLSL